MFPLASRAARRLVGESMRRPTASLAKDAPVALLVVKGAYIVAVAIWLGDIAPWLPWLTGLFAGICAWNVVQIVRAR